MKLTKSKEFYYIAMLILWIAFVLWVYFSGKINIYIKRTYHVFTVLIIPFFFAMVHFQFKKLLKSPSKLEKDDAWILSIFLAPIIFAVLINPSGLNSFAASKRGVVLSADRLNTSLLKALREEVEQEGQYKKINILQILSAAGKFTDKINGISVATEGFIFKDKNTADSRVVLFQFLIVCCAADARPVGIKVISEGGIKYKADTWVRVYGKCIVENGEVSIIADKIISVCKPQDTYLYSN